MTDSPLKLAIEAYVKRKPTATFVEMCKEIPGFKGDYDIGLPGNRVLWTGLSKEASDMVGELLREKRIHMVPTKFFVYLIDGACLNLPLVKTVRPYKRPHWLPVVFSPGPDPDPYVKKKSRSSSS